MKRKVVPTTDLLLLVPGVVTLAGMLELFALITKRIEVFAPANGTLVPHILMEAAARIQFSSILMLFVVLSVAIIGKVLLDIVRDFDPRSAILLVSTAVLLFLMFYLIIQDLPNDERFFGQNLFDEADRRMATDPQVAWLGPHALYSVLIFYSSVVAVMASVFMVGIVSCASVASNPMIRLRTYVVLCTSLLALGILVMQNFVRFPTFLLSDPDDTRAYDFLVSAYSLRGGVTYSIALATIALPAAWLVERRNDGGVSIVAGAKMSAPPVASNSSESATAMLLQILLAVLVPLLAGSLPSLTEIFR